MTQTQYISNKPLFRFNPKCLLKFITISQSHIAYKVLQLTSLLNFHHIRIRNSLVSLPHKHGISNLILNKLISTLTSDGKVCAVDIVSYLIDISYVYRKKDGGYVGFSKRDWLRQ